MKRVTIILANVGSVNVSDIENAIKTVGLSTEYFVFVDWGNNTHLAVTDGISTDCLPMEILIMYLTKMIASKSNEL